jgi:transposase
MVYRKISTDLKEAAIRLKARGRDTDYEISQIVGFSTRTLYRVHRQKFLTGSAAPAQAISRGRPRSLLRRDCNYLLRLARHKPTLFLDEYARQLQRYRELSVCVATIHRTLERAGLKVKHVQKLAAERDPVLRADFIRRIGQYPAHYLLSIDEVSKDDRTYTRLWGRASVGCRAEQHAPFVHKRRYSMIAALALDEGIVASRVLEGSFTHDTFLEYLRDDVVSCAIFYTARVDLSSWF